MSKRITFIIAVGGLILLAAAGWWFWLRPSAESQPSSGLQPGINAPDFSLQDPDGNLVTLSGLKGKPVIVVFWTSSCSACAQDMALIENIYTQNQAAGLSVLAINVTTQDSAEAAVTFYSAQKLTFPILFDADNQVYKLYQVEALPATFFVDRSGAIQAVMPAGPADAAAYQQRVQAILAQ
jgi:peroxiredoxin